MATKANPLIKALEAAGLDGSALIAEVNRAVLKPGDLVVFRSESALRPEFKVYLMKQGRRLFPGHEVIVLDGGIDLQIVAEAEAEGGSGG